jgi:drug/metabolite transporter (DMT)-like permease
LPFLSDAAVGALCATGSALTWSLINLLVRSLSPAFNSVTLNALRSTVGSVLVVVWIAAVGGLGGLTDMSAQSMWLLAISVILAVGVGDTIFFESVKWLGLVRAMTVSMIYPLFAALLAAVLLAEAPTMQVSVGGLLTLAGLILTVRARGGEAVPTHGRFWLGLAAALVAALTWALSVILLKPALEEVDSIRSQAIRLPLAAAVLWAMPWAWSARRPLSEMGRTGLWQLAALGALSAASSILFVAGVRYAGVAVATVLSSTAPIFALPLGFFFLGERVPPIAVAGIILTILGITVLQH